MYFFEKNRVDSPEGFDRSKWGTHLQEVWRTRYSFGLEDASRHQFNAESSQPILKFSTTHDEMGNELNYITAGNYIGTVQLGNEQINIVPKILNSEANQNLMKSDEKLFSRYVNSHVLWWMSYTNKIRLPKTFASYDTAETDLFEILIYLFSYYTEELVSEFGYNNYEEVEDDLTMVRGRIKMNDYISNIANGAWHKIPCEYSEFQHDNLLNQIILFVAKLLSEKTKEMKSKRLLDEIIGHLSGVSSIQVTTVDCERVKLNPMYDEYTIVLDYCRMFLDNIVTGSAEDDVSVFAFLVDMNWLYEEFLRNFMNTHKSALNLARNVKKDSSSSLGVNASTGDNAFRVELDYLLNFNREVNETRIADAKYKRIFEKVDPDDYKTVGFGIKSADMYQMISYAYRKGIDKINLLYPLYAAEEKDGIMHKFEIFNKDENVAVHVTASTINIVERDIALFDNSGSIQTLFSEAEERLIHELNSVFQ